MTEEKKKEIEADAEKTAQDVSSDPSDQNMFYCGYIAGATAEAEKYPCSLEEVREAIELLKDILFLQDREYCYKKIETFLTKLK